MVERTPWPSRRGLHGMPCRGVGAGRPRGRDLRVPDAREEVRHLRGQAGALPAVRGDTPPPLCEGGAEEGREAGPRTDGQTSADLRPSDREGVLTPLPWRGMLR